MSNQTTENHSQHEANKAIRVLSGKPLKYTVRVYIPDGRVIEFQTEKLVKVEYNSDTRAIWLHQSVGDYSSVPVMQWIEGSILLMEENPKP